MLLVEGPKTTSPNFQLCVFFMILGSFASKSPKTFKQSISSKGCQVWELGFRNKFKNHQCITATEYKRGCRNISWKYQYNGHRSCINLIDRP